jgi:hypothetical protein
MRVRGPLLLALGTALVTVAGGALRVTPMTPPHALRDA